MHKYPYSIAHSNVANYTVQAHLWAWGLVPHQVLADQFTLFQPHGGIMPTLYGYLYQVFKATRAPAMHMSDSQLIQNNKCFNLLIQ